jgi:alpha-N-acetylglucosaminidase
MPLSVVGLEGVWYHALLRVGYTDEEARDFLVGPAYLAWQWMTNIESANGPLPKSWIDKHIQLGKRIIERQVSLGMQPIQQGFSGYVPRKFIEKFPEAKIAYGSGWCSFDATAQLDPLDSLFKQFGQIFLEEQQRLFGSYGYYAADPFHEGTPPQKDKPYLHAVGKAIHELLTGFDSDAHIVMQAWSIREDIVKAIPKDRVLILDLAGSKYKEKGKEGFWGYNFVVGNLHNFGGRINLHGDVRLLASNQFAIAKSIYPHAVGAGLFMEAIEQNPLYYDLAFEMPFHQHEIDPKPWIKNYLMRRYGKEVDAMDYMAELLLDGPYKQGTNGTENSSIIAARPALEVKKSGPNAGFSIPYDAKSLVRLWKLLLKERSLQKSDGYRFDVMDIGRQVLSNLGQEIHKEAIKSYKEGNEKNFIKHSTRFLGLLKDVDMLLGSRSDFNFNTWLAAAQAQADNEEEKALYTYNASLLVTWWGGDKEPSIFDYSWREWNGLIGDYYYGRWKLFYDMLGQSLKKGVPYEEEGLKMVHGRESLRANAFYNQLADWESVWIKKAKKPVAPTFGKELTYAQNLLSKYDKLFNEYY